MTLEAQQDGLLQDVLGTFSAPDARLQTILQSAIRHLHAFVRDVELDHTEWEAGIGFLTAVGAICTDSRQEFILLSDTLGVSSLMEMTSAGSTDGATENTVLGPFYVPGSPFRTFGDSILEDGADVADVAISGSVLDIAGNPIPGATLDIWQNAPNRLYAVQDPGQHPHNLRARFLTGSDGGFSFRTIRPVPYPIPDDGPVGKMLGLTGRHPWRPAHVHFLVTAPGFRSLTTHVFDAQSEYLDSDAVFGVRHSLLMKFEPAGEGANFAANFTISLEPDLSPATKSSGVVHDRRAGLSNQATEERD